MSTSFISSSTSSNVDNNVSELMPIVLSKIQTMHNNVEETTKNLEPLFEVGQQSAEQMCGIIDSLMEFGQNVIDIKREHLEQIRLNLENESSSSSSSTSNASNEFKNVNNINPLIPTSNLHPIVVHSKRSIKYLDPNQDENIDAGLQILNNSLEETNKKLKLFVDRYNNYRQIFSNLFRTISNNYATRVLTNDYQLKNIPEPIAFAVQNYTLAAIKVVLDMCATTLPSSSVAFDKNRKEYIERLEKSLTNNTTSTINAASNSVEWLAFLKELSQFKAKTLVSRYLNLITQPCVTAQFKNCVNAYNKIKFLKYWLTSSNNELASTSRVQTPVKFLDSVLEVLFPGQVPNSIGYSNIPQLDVASANALINTTPKTSDPYTPAEKLSLLLTSKKMECHRTNPNDVMALREYIEAPTVPDLCSERSRLAYGADDYYHSTSAESDNFICRGINLLTANTEQMMEQVKHGISCGIDKDVIIEQLIDQYATKNDLSGSSRQLAGAGTQTKRRIAKILAAIDDDDDDDDDEDDDEEDNEYNSSKRQKTMSVVESAEQTLRKSGVFTLDELNRLIAPLSFTLFREFKIPEYQHFNITNDFSDLSEKFSGQAPTIQEFFDNVNIFYPKPGSTDLSLWQLINNCFDVSESKKLTSLLTKNGRHSEFMNITKSLYLIRTCLLSYNDTDMTLNSALNEVEKEFFPYVMTFREGSFVSQYLCKRQDKPSLAMPSISLYALLDSFLTQPHIFLIILYMLGLYRHWLDEQMYKTTTTTSSSSSSAIILTSSSSNLNPKQKILSTVQGLMSSSSANSTTASTEIDLPFVLTLFALAKFADFIFYTVKFNNLDVEENQLDVSKSLLERMQEFGSVEIKSKDDFENQLSLLVRTATVYHERIALRIVGKAEENILFIMQTFLTKWASVCTDNLKYAEYMNNQPPGKTICETNRNIGFAIFARNKDLIKPLESIPELNTINYDSGDNLDSNNLDVLSYQKLLQENLSDTNFYLPAGTDDNDNDEHQNHNQQQDQHQQQDCNMDNLYIARSYNYLTKFLHDCLTKQVLGPKFDNLITKWFYYALDKNTNLDKIKLFGSDTMQLISYANIFTDARKFLTRFFFLYKQFL